MDFSKISSSNSYNQNINKNTSIQNSSIASALGDTVSGKIVSILGNRVIIDNNSDKYLDILLKGSLPDNTKKGDYIDLDASEISNYKYVPKVTDQYGDFDLKEMDINQQILFGLKLNFDKKNIDALNILKENNLTVSKEAINKLVNLQNKFEYILDNSTTVTLDHLGSIKHIDRQNIEHVFNEIKQLADKLPLSNEELQNFDVESIISELSDINSDSEKLKDTISSIIKNNLPPTRNNVNKVNSVLVNIEKIQDINGKTVGYVVKNNIDLTINNLLKSKLSFDNLKNIVSSNQTNYIENNYYNSKNQYATSNDFSGNIDLSALKDDIENILKLEKLPVNDDNIKASEILIENDMEVNKTNITKITNLLKNIKVLKETTDSDTVCKLIKNNVDIPNVKIDIILDYVTGTKEDSSIDKAALYKLLQSKTAASLGTENSNINDESKNLENAIKNYDNQNDINAKNLAYSINLDSKKAEINIKEILESISVPVNSSTIEAAKALISSNVDITKEAVSDILNIMNLAKAEADKYSLSNIDSPQLDALSSFNKAIINLKNIDYKAIGFLYKNNLATSISNLLYSKSIIMAKDAVNLDSSQNISNMPNNYSFNSILDRNTDNIVEELLSSQKLGLSELNEESINEIFNKSLIYPKNLDSSLEKGLNINLKTALLRMGLPINDENISIAKSLIQNTLNINRNSILDIQSIKNSIKDLILNSDFLNSLPDNWQNDDIRNLNKYLEKTIENNPDKNNKRIYKNLLSGIIDELKDVDTNTFSFMIKNNISPSLKNIYSSKMFIENKFMLGKQINDLQNAISKCDDLGFQIKAKTLMNNFLQKSADLKNISGNISDIYKDIHNTVQNLQNYLSQTSIKNSTNISKALYDIDANLGLQSRLNISNTIMQMPILLNNQLTNLQLYVMNKSDSGKKKQINPENMDVFLHLNTQNLGSVDTFINFKKQHISLRFGVESDAAANLINKSTQTLEKIIEKIGFENIHISSFTKDEDINILNAKEQMLNEISKENGNMDSNNKIKLDNNLFDFKA